MAVALADEDRSIASSFMSVIAGDITRRNIDAPQQDHCGRGEVFTVRCFLLENEIRNRIAGSRIGGAAVLVVSFEIVLNQFHAFGRISFGADDLQRELTYAAG